VITNTLLSTVSNTPTGTVKNLISYSDNAKWEKGEDLIATRMKSFLKSENATENIRISMGELVYDESGAGKLDDYQVEEIKIDEDDIFYDNTTNLREENGESEAAIVHANLTFDNERVTKKWEFDLVKENGKWKVLSYRPI
ncbi:hypothetical protein QL992_16145, partial [Microbacterium sp. APC 3898]